MFELLAVFLHKLLRIIARRRKIQLKLREHKTVEKMEQKDGCIFDREVTTGGTELWSLTVAGSVVDVGNCKLHHHHQTPTACEMGSWEMRKCAWPHHWRSKINKKCFLRLHWRSEKCRRPFMGAHQDGNLFTRSYNCTSRIALFTCTYLRCFGNIK